MCTSHETAYFTHLTSLIMKITCQIYFDIHFTDERIEAQENKTAIKYQC